MADFNGLGQNCGDHFCCFFSRTPPLLSSKRKKIKTNKRFRTMAQKLNTSNLKYEVERVGGFKPTSPPLKPHNELF